MTRFTALGSWKKNILIAAVGITWMTVYGCSAAKDDSDAGAGGSATAVTSKSSAGGSGAAEDTDGDGISDVDEGAEEKVDTDGDGTPDFQDTDSDDDTIDDSIEAGDTQLATLPVDSDSDGVPDFRDLDSDNNEIPDEKEGTEDFDGDTVPDYADLDNDGDSANDAEEIRGVGMDCNSDGMADAEGSADAPADCDQDGKPNYMDEDSDGDTIRDSFEGVKDTDGDLFFDRYELDSDNDTYSDAVEAGDEDLTTAPIDTDMDMIPDYIDPDSDQDGLSDAQEAKLGTDPKKQDTDGDGVSDLIESAAETDPLDATKNPQAEGNFVFVVPYEDTTVPAKDTLSFRTSVQFADLYFLFDETGSMYEEFAAMNNANTGVSKIISQLKCQTSNVACLIDSDCGANEICFQGSGKCIESPITANNGEGCVPDLWTGVGRFNNCNTYNNTLSLQPDATKTTNSVGSPGPGYAESVYQSAACVADDSLCSNNNGCGADASIANPVGCPGFRDDAVRILLHITDAGNQGSSCMSNVSIAGDALKNAKNAKNQMGMDIKYIGLYGTSDNGGSPCSSAQSCTSNIGVAAGSVDKNNQPFVYSALNANLPNVTRKAVLEIVRGVPLNVTIAADDEPMDAGDALQFVDYLEVNVSGQGNCTMVSKTSDTDNDGKPDSFPELLGGVPVCWNVIPVDKQSTTKPTVDPQLFKAKLTVAGDGSPLDSRKVFFLVPPKPPEVPQGPK